MARNGISLCTARIVTGAASMLALPVLYERLGARQFGVWAVLTGAMAIVALMDMGLGSSQVREVARSLGGGSGRRARAVLGLGVVWAVGFGVLLVAATVVCWPWLTRGFHLGELAARARSAALFLQAGFVLDNLAMPWQAVLEGNQQYAAVARVSGGASVCGAGLAVIVVARGGGLVALGASSAAISAARALLLALAARRCAPALTPSLLSIKREDVSAVMGYGTRVQVSNAAAAINSETDRLVLAGFTSPVTVSGFDLGSRLVNVVRLPAEAVLTTLFPAAVTTACGDSKDRLDGLYLQMTRYLSVYAAATTAALVASADPLVRLWLGHRVPLAATTIAVLTLGCAVNLTSGAAAIVTRSEGRPGRETRYALVAACLNVLLTIPLLRLCGPAGVPLSTTLAASAATGYFFVHFHRSSRRPIAPLGRIVMPPAAASLIAGALTWMTAKHLPDGSGRVDAAIAVASRSGMAVVIVIGTLAALGFFDRTDWARLRTLVCGLVPIRSTAGQPDRRNR
ncbi:lipopolysaccharide biosynthesis protein [Streptantibioticus ferralitis]|uniref:Lipopolysaccharide biosynthesis protein n=1 Tax=Streptantibioticus ferralitis TaxID=236510 RepID=A0ABT5Z0T2_9ACTN|nr:lipopolysaccharide biosynthesis protein [Streptantibioticus ferralitis]MDF2257449.1 lipopolysaccharide biosynthesis protein [Streptantibioticus ferralitis]